jgi:hypothetical protein
MNATNPLAAIRNQIIGSRALSRARSRYLLPLCETVTLPSAAASPAVKPRRVASTSAIRRVGMGRVMNERISETTLPECRQRRELCKAPA